MYEKSFIKKNIDLRNRRELLDLIAEITTLGFSMLIVNLNSIPNKARLLHQESILLPPPPRDTRQ